MLAITARGQGETWGFFVMRLRGKATEIEQPANVLSRRRPARPGDAIDRNQPGVSHTIASSVDGSRSLVVLMIGTDLTVMTLIHLAETTTPASYVRATCRRVRSAAGWVWYWGAPSSCSDGFTKAAAALERATLALGKLGAAETCVVSAADLVESIRGKLISDPAWLLCDRPGCRGCGLARQYLAGEIDCIISGDQSAWDDSQPAQPLEVW